LRPRGRTRLMASGAAVQLRLATERRSGFDAGRELYGALNRIGELRDRTDLIFERRRSYLDPRAEKIRLFAEQALRYAGAPAARAHVGSFIRGMWAARRDANKVLQRVQNDIRNLG
jgi:hypothetical protein